MGEYCKLVRRRVHDVKPGEVLRPPVGMRSPWGEDRCEGGNPPPPSVLRGDPPPLHVVCPL